MTHKFIPQDLHNYQRKAILHQLYHENSMLWLGMSLGKTVITLSTIEHRMRAQQLQKTLIFAPVRVCYGVWEREARKWAHTKHLTFSIIHGDEKRRLRALFTEADIYLCNYENMAWLSNQLDHYYIDQDRPLPFQMCVYDEVSRVKDSTSQRINGGNRVVEKEKVEMLLDGGIPYDAYIKAGWSETQMVEQLVCKIHPRKMIHFLGWRKMIEHFKFRTGLTGTPAPNGYKDLHGQFLCVDGGQRLEEYITSFRQAYLTPDWSGFDYIPTDMGKSWIQHKVSDITLSMKTEDYIELPPTIINDIEVILPDKVRKKYDEVEQDMFTQLDCGTEIELFNRASVSNKCLQFANGSPYKSPESKEWTALHDAKLQALDSIVEEAAGMPVAVSYLFRSDAERMAKRYRTKKFNVVNVTEAKSSQIPKIIEDWCAGKIHMLIGHPASMGHGLDGLQDFGDIVVWFGLNWNLELYLQMNARFMRQGRDRPLTIHRLICPDTVDVAVGIALEDKADDENGLRSAVNQYRKQKQLAIAA